MCFLAVDVRELLHRPSVDFDTLTDDRFWATSIAQAVMIVASYFTFRETFASAILERRAKSLRRSTGLFYYTAAACQHQGKSIAKVLQRSLSRPLRLLVYHPLIQINGALSAFSKLELYQAA